MEFVESALEGWIAGGSMELGVYTVFRVLMRFGTLAVQEANRNWSFLLLLHDPCHRAPLYQLKANFR